MAKDNFLKYCEENNIKIDLIEKEETSRTAEEAAKAHGVPVCNIVKSLVVKADEEFLVFLVPGDKRIDFDYIKNTYGFKKARMANADEVKEVTGYSIGGVPPFGHKNKLKIYIYDGFDKTQDLYAAAGAHNATFKITFDQLKSLVEK